MMERERERVGKSNELLYKSYDERQEMRTEEKRRGSREGERESRPDRREELDFWGDGNG